jgi:hypothetical protein
MMRAVDWDMKREKRRMEKSPLLPEVINVRA